MLDRIKFLLAASIASATLCSKGYIITTKPELALVKNCTYLTGFVKIDISNHVAVAMPNLVGAKQMIISGAGINSIDFPKVSHFDSLFITNTPNLSSLKFPHLTTVDDIYLIGTGNLESISFSAGLKACGSFNLAKTKIQTLAGMHVTLLDQLDLQDNPNLQLALPHLDTIKGDLTLKGNYSSILEVPNLTTVFGHFTLINAPKVNLPLLKQVKGNCYIDNFKGKNISIPITSIDGSLAVTDSQVLETLSLNRLEYIGVECSIINNEKLTLLRLQSLTSCRQKFNLDSPVLGTIKLSRNLARLPNGNIHVPAVCAATKQGLEMPNHERRCKRVLENLVRN